MIGALAGGDALEIIVQLKDLSEAGFKKVEGSLHHMESTANGVNTSGFSKAAKGMEKDAEAAAGKKGGGGILGLASGLTSLGGGPVTLAIGGLMAVAGAGIKLTETYDQVEKQENQLRQAARQHGVAMADLNKFVEDSISTNEQYGYSADGTRGAILALTNAGMSLADQQKAMGPIADLARAKNIGLAEAANMYELAIMGNARAVKQFGILLPPVSASAADVGKATAGAAKAHDALTLAQEKLAIVEDKLKGKHTLTAAEALRLQQAHDAVQRASDKLRGAQDKLTLAQKGGIDKGERLKIVNDAIAKSIGDQRAAATPMEKAQAKLSDAWERMSKLVGPILEHMFTGLIDIVSGFLDVISKVIDALGKMIDLAGKGAQVVANSPVGKVAGGIGDAWAHTGGGIINNIAGFLPHFASGGVVTRPTLAMIGEGGEREFVIPESRMRGMGGQVVEVHTHLHLDEQQIAHVVNRVLGSDYNLGGSAAFGFGGS